MTHHLVEMEEKALNLQNAGRFREAADLFAAIVKEQPDWEHGAGFYCLAVNCEDSGQLEKAEEAYKSALRYQPAYDIFLGGYAAFLYLHGDPEQAFTKHLELLEVQKSRKNNAAIESTTLALRAVGKKMGLSDAEIENRIKKGIFGDKPGEFAERQKDHAPPSS
jgi:Flp pilus assembly protein TadD